VCVYVLFLFTRRRKGESIEERKGSFTSAKSGRRDEHGKRRKREKETQEEEDEEGSSELHRFLNLLGRVRGLERVGKGTRGGKRDVVATLSEFVRLKIYPMCTVYQAVAVPIGARVCVLLCFIPPFLLLFSLFVYFLRARLFSLPPLPADTRSFS